MKNWKKEPIRNRLSCFFAEKNKNKSPNQLVKSFNEDDNVLTAIEKETIFKQIEMSRNVLANDICEAVKEYFDNVVNDCDTQSVKNNNIQIKNSIDDIEISLTSMLNTWQEFSDIYKGICNE